MERIVILPFMVTPSIRIDWIIARLFSKIPYPAVREDDRRVDRITSLASRNQQRERRGVGGQRLQVAPMAL
jgi:hypothetical protein